MTLNEKVLKDLERWQAWVDELEKCDMSDAGHSEEPSEGLIDEVRRAVTNKVCDRSTEEYLMCHGGPETII